MPTLTPTKQLGATTKRAEMTVAEPDCTVDDAALAATIDVPGMNAAFLADFLSAALTHERCGVHLYRSVAGRTQNPMLRRTYERLGEETLRHVEILERLVTGCGGNPMYTSPMARAVEGMDAKNLESTFLLSGSADLMVREMCMLDAVFLAESVCHGNWSTVAELTNSLPQGAVRDAFQRAVDEVESQEDEHLEWARTTRSRLAVLQASCASMPKAGAKAEELVATVRGWFS
jgi:rubrerythrin